MNYVSPPVRALAERIANYAETAISYANWSKRDCLIEAVRLTCEDAREDTLQAMGVRLVTPCTHESSTGVDQATIGPDKVWACDGCGWRHRTVMEDGFSRDVDA